MGQGCVWGTQQQDRGQWEQTGTQRAPSKHKEELLCCEGGRGLEQSLGEVGGTLFFPGVAHTCLDAVLCSCCRRPAEGGVEWGISRDPFHRDNSTVLLCDPSLEQTALV